MRNVPDELHGCRYAVAVEWLGGARAMEADNVDMAGDHVQADKWQTDLTSLERLCAFAILVA